MESSLVLCSGNTGKIAEMKALLPAHYRVLGLADVGLGPELPETGATLHANALQKAAYVHERCGLPCLADDTGLEVDALHGAPGVFSARFAGPQKSAEANMVLLLQRLAGVTKRRARFRTVLAYVHAQGSELFEGVLEGTIAQAPRGTQGFGYDPVFLPHMSDLTLGELSAEKKNAISHRAQAMWKAARSLSGH
jgi:XTP/dITP diphosphohydrolase